MFDNKSELEKRLETKGDKSELLKMVIFYDKVLKVFKKYEIKLKFIEISPKIENLEKDKYSLDFSNFVVFINNNEYLMFLINDKPETLKMENLERYNEIYRRQSMKTGIFIVYNDYDLNSHLLLSEELYSIKRDLPNVYQKMKKKYVSLKDRIEKLIIEPEYNLKKLYLKKQKREDIIDKFHKLLKNFIKNEFQRTRLKDRKEFLNEFDSTKISKLLYDLEGFFEGRIKKEGIEQIFKELI